MAKKEINMEATTEVKGIARALGKALAGMGYPVPHSVVLQAVSRSAGQGPWQAHRSRLTVKENGSSGVVKPEAPVEATPQIPAQFWTDDRAYELDFDAGLWILQAEESELLSLLACGFGRDYPADAVAYWTAENGVAPDRESLGSAFLYLDASNRAPGKRDRLGFEVEVSAEPFVAWLQKSRPAVLALYVCDQYGVRLTEAQEDEVRGMWDWHTASEGCEHSFATRNEAAVNAAACLGLFKEFEEERGINFE